MFKDYTRLKNLIDKKSRQERAFSASVGSSRLQFAKTYILKKPINFN